MRTVEAALGLLIITAALALALGAARLLAPVPPAGLGVTLALIGWGATLAAHGMAGRAITKRRPLPPRTLGARFSICSLLSRWRQRCPSWSTFLTSQPSPAFLWVTT